MEADPPRSAAGQSSRWRVEVPRESIAVLAEAGMKASGLHRRLRRDPDAPPMAEYEVFLWGSLIANERVVWGQAMSAFVREARKARISDDQIRYVLELDDDINVDHYSERLYSEALAHVLRHEKLRRGEV